MISIKNFLWVGLGGAIGSVGRFWVSSLFKPAAFPLSTLIINITGSLLIGLIFGLSLKNDNIPEYLRLFLAVGICGGFTTFSAFSLENIQLLRAGNYLTAASYIMISVIACITACFIGFKIVNH